MIYKVFSYTLGSDDKLELEETDLDTAVLRAMFISKELGEGYGVRLDTYERGVWVGRCRWFQNGKEITEEIIKKVIGTASEQLH